jgi:MoaA/NifB/PqqE/SkfB family radical SAM enzyme
MRILTNGTALDQQMLNEIAEVGIRFVRVSCYSEKESERLEGLKKPKKMLKYSFMHPTLDDRLCHYKREPLDLKIPCYAPLYEIMVACEGFVALCCFDWKRHVKFGNLHKKDLEDVISNGRLRKVYARLSQGDRYLPLCRRCDRLLHSGKYKKIWKDRIRNETA